MHRPCFRHHYKLVILFRPIATLRSKEISTTSDETKMYLRNFCVDELWMQVWRFVVLLPLVSGCSVVIKPIPTPILNSASVEDRRVVQIIDEFTNRLPLNLNQIAVVVDPETRTKYCEGLTDACTYHVRASKQSIIHVPWDYNYAPQQLLAHELCHAYYFQVSGNPDPNHEHKECFDEVVKRL